MVDPFETIVAIATPRGGAARGILRLSGPMAWQIVGQSFDAPLPVPTDETRPHAIVGRLSLPPLTNSAPATLFLSRTPRSFTGQDLVEVHTLGSPPILELALSTFCSRGARQALPGEFTMRAFLSGKLDLAEAEAILGLIDATNFRQADVALRQLAGGISQPIGQLRDRLLDLLAELEAGLDFAEEKLEFIDRGELHTVLETAVSQLSDLGRQMEGRGLGVDRLRAVLTGPPNVGKSSLFNALLGRDAALVSQTAGTTRDYLVGELKLTSCSIELADTAGTDETDSAINQQAQRLREQAANEADLVLWCVDSTDPTAWNSVPTVNDRHARDVMIVQTKIDLLSTDGLQPPDRKSDTVRRADSDSPGRCDRRTIPVSARTGAGLRELLRAIDDWVGRGSKVESAIVASTGARCRQAIAGAEAATTRALAALDSGSGDDIIALELRVALDELAQVVGAVYTDDILDRIFSRFCIGK